MINRREFGSLAAGALAAAGAVPARAQGQAEAYPHRVVHARHPFEPGRRQRRVPARDGASTCRSTSRATFVVENVAGRQRRARDLAPRDGAARRQRLLRDDADLHLHLAAVAAAARLSRPRAAGERLHRPEVVYTRADGPFKTLEDVIDHARERRAALGRGQPGLARALRRPSSLRRAANVNARGRLARGRRRPDDQRAQRHARHRRRRDPGDPLAARGEQGPPARDLQPERLAGLPDAADRAGKQASTSLVQKFRGLAGPKGMPPEVDRASGSGDPAAARRLRTTSSVYEAENLVPNFMPHDEYGASSPTSRANPRRSCARRRHRG